MASANCGGTVKFAPGSSSGTVQGTVSGYETCDYTLRAQKGQVLSASLARPNGLDVIMLDPVEHDFANGALTLPKSGDYKVRVVQPRNEARRGRSRDFALTIGVTGRPTPASPAPATRPAPAAKPAAPPQSSASVCEGSGALHNGMANMSGTLGGNDVCRYSVQGRAGQKVTLLMDAPPGVEVWMRAPGDDTGIPLDPAIETVLDKTGDYAVTISRTRNDARKGGVREFSAVLNLD